MMRSSQIRPNEYARPATWCTISNTVCEAGGDCPSCTKGQGEKDKELHTKWMEENNP